MDRSREKYTKTINDKIEQYEFLCKVLKLIYKDYRKRIEYLRILRDNAKRD